MTSPIPERLDPFNDIEEEHFYEEDHLELDEDRYKQLLEEQYDKRQEQTHIEIDKGIQEVLDKRVKQLSKAK
jgi:hypothetical protein